MGDPALRDTPIVLTQGELLLNKDLIIEARGNEPATITAQGSSRVFDIAANAHVVLSNLTITGGSLVVFPLARGAGIYNAGTLTLARSTVSGNSTFEGLGDGIYNSGALTVTESLQLWGAECEE